MEACTVTQDDPPKDLFGYPIDLSNRRPRRSTTVQRSAPPVRPPAEARTWRLERRLRWWACGLGGLVLLALVDLATGVLKEPINRLGGSYVEAQVRRLFGIEQDKLPPFEGPATRIETGSISVTVPPQQQRASPAKPKKTVVKEKTWAEKLFPLLFETRP
jgi:hypothetical protein